MSGILKTWVFILLFFVVRAGLGQSAVDSLRILINESNEPKHRVDLQNNLARALLESSIEESLQVSSRALVESRKIDYRTGEGWALLNQAIYHQLVGQPDEALSVNVASEQVARGLDDPRMLGSIWLQRGRIFRDIGLMDSTIRYYRLAEVIHEENSHLQNLWQVKSSLSRYYLLTGDPSKALVASNQSLHVAELLKNKELVAYSWLDIGDCYRDMLNFDEARKFYGKATTLSADAAWLQTDYNESIGQMHYLIGNFDDAYRATIEVIKAYEVFEGRHTLAASLIRMAQIMGEKGLLDISMEYLIRALRIAETAGYKNYIADVNFEMARINYQSNSTLGIALSNLKRAEGIYVSLNNRSGFANCQSVKGIICMKKRDFDSSMYFHQVGLDLRRKAGNKIAVSSSMIHIGDLYYNMDNKVQALDYYLKGLQLEQEIGDLFGVCQYKNKIGGIYLDNGDFEQATKYLNEAVLLANKSSSMTWLAISYDNLAKLVEAKGDFRETLRYRKRYEQINDSLFNVETAQSLVSYKILNDLAQKEQVIRSLSADKQSQQTTIESRTLIIFWVASFALILILLVYVLVYFSWKQRNSNRSLVEKNKEVKKQSSELQKTNNFLVALNDQMRMQRDEIISQAEQLKLGNEAIARIKSGLEEIVEQRTSDLSRAYEELDIFFYRSSHDFRRPLTTLMGLCELAKLSVTEQSAIELFKKVGSTAVELDKMLIKLQSVSHVGSDKLEKREVALKQIIDNEIASRNEIIRGKKINIGVEIRLERNFMSYPELIKVIAGTLLENAIEFCNPSEPSITISAHDSGDSFIMEVQDNGEGIKDEAKPQVFEMFFRGTTRSAGNGLGLYIARKAVEKAEGTISFKNNPERGTTFTVEIPNQQTPKPTIVRQTIL